MRKVLFAIVLTCSLLPMVQCSSDETISGFDGNVVVAASPYIKTAFNFPLFRYSIQTDSIKWLYDYDAGKESRVSIIAGGKFCKDSIISFTGDDAATAKIDSVLPLPVEIADLYFGIETFLDTSLSIKPAKINPDGTFLDTFQVASSSVSERILTQNCRLYAKMKMYNDTIAGTDSVIIIKHEIYDVVPLLNPHGLQK